MSEGMKKIEEALASTEPADDFEHAVLTELMKMLAALSDMRGGSELHTVMAGKTHEYILTFTRKRL